MKAKSKKWAAESLISETERKAIASPEQQKMAGELTAEMLLMMTPIPGGKKLLNLAKKAFKGKGKGKAAKDSDKKLLELYQKAHPRTRKPPAKNIANKAVKKIKKIADKYVDPPDDIKYIKSRAAIAIPAVIGGYSAKYAEENKKKNKKAKGGSVKKYARGGGVRAARF